MAERLKKGIVQIYTGNGKGKTTAACGLALRAVGAGLKVYIQQFAKNMPYGETKVLKSIKNVEIRQCGRRCFIKAKPTKEDIRYARKGLREARDKIYSGRYDLVILDEVNIALKLGLLKTNDIVEIIEHKPHFVELVLTGRYCPPALIECADLVTEMREVKHPFGKGLKARRGIEF